MDYQRMRRAGRSRRGTAPAAIAALAAMTVAGGLQAVAAAPAEAAVPGLIRVTHSMTALDSVSPKDRTAVCPLGLKVVGGGGHVVGPAAGAIRLRVLRPFAGTTIQDRYQVIAEEPPGGVAGTWALEGYALCAPAEQLPGYEIVSRGTAPSTQTHQETTAGCSNGKRVIGVGASVIGGTSGSSPGLQMSRAAGTLDITRAAAALEPAVATANWQVIAHAICADPVGAAAEGDVVYDRTDAIKECSGTRKVHSVGGATGDGATRPVFLSELYPSSDLRATVLRLTGRPADGLAVQAVCA